jgi:N-acyl homoserine lactone hydrolase
VPPPSVELELLWCGNLRVPPGWFFREPGRLAVLGVLGVGVSKTDLLDSPVGAFLVQHPEAGPILVDTGVHPNAAADLVADFGQLNARAFGGMQVSRERSVPAQLRARGIDPRAIARVVMTHLHVDHASGMSEFPNAEFVCSTREWDAASGRFGAYHGYHRPQLPPPHRVRRIDFEGASAQPHGPFTRTVDLLGDGSIRLLYTPGHTAGHLSLLLRLEDREALVIGDAVYTLRNLREHRRPFRVEDDEGYDRSVAEIGAFAAANPDALLIPTHDQEVWEELFAGADRELPRLAA